MTPLPPDEAVSLNMWHMMELAMGVLAWSYDQWRQAGLFEMAAALSGKAYLHGMTLPYFQKAMGPDKAFLQQMMAQCPDKIERVKK